MEINEINLDFLWEKNRTFVLDGPTPFWEKWRDEKRKYAKFIETEPLEKVIALMIISFKDNYPRDSWFGILVNSMEGVNSIQTQDKYSILDGKYIVRDDISTLKWIEKQDKDKFEYDYERIFEFYEPVSLTDTIEEHLSDKTYTKESIDDGTLYKVEQSPIAEIAVTPKSFRLTINEEFYERRST